MIEIKAHTHEDIPAWQGIFKGYCFDYEIDQHILRINDDEEIYCDYVTFDPYQEPFELGDEVFIILMPSQDDMHHLHVIKRKEL